jgi:citrate lyase alpha subunit
MRAVHQAETVRTLVDAQAFESAVADSRAQTLAHARAPNVASLSFIANTSQVAAPIPKLDVGD